MLEYKANSDKTALNTLNFIKFIYQFFFLIIRTIFRIFWMKHFLLRQISNQTQADKDVGTGAERRRHDVGGAADRRGGGVPRRDRSAGGRALRGQLRLREAALLAVRLRRASSRVQQNKVQDMWVW